MNLSRLLVVARKELMDGFRDRRSIYTMLFTTLFGPLLIAFMLSHAAGQKKAAEEIQVPVVGRELAPALVDWLGQQSGVQVIPGPADPEAAVRNGKVDVVLVIKSEFAGNFGQSRSAPVQLFFDSTRTSAQPKVRRLALLLTIFNSETAAQRLIVRGISPEVIAPLKMDEVDTANSQQRAATLLNIVLTFLALAVLTAGMQIATDSTAGERERRSLEPLLLNPVPRWQIVGGKWLASSVAALGGLLATLLIISKVLSRLSLEDLGVRFHMGRPEILLLIATMAPLALMMPSIQVYLSCFARSFKEAQSYTVILVLPVAVIGVVSNFYPMTDLPLMRAIPVLAQYSMGTDILAGKGASVLALFLSGAEAVALGGLFLYLAARLFSSERIIFGR